MKKRILSLLCVLALCLGLLPVTALAEENAPTTLYVGDQSLLVGTNSYWTTDGDGTLTASTESENWNIKYEYSTVTLTLKNATIKGVSDNVNTVGAGIYAASSSGPVSLNIVLEGENKVSGGYGINVSSGGAASLSISGSGSLTVSATATNGIGIFVQAQSGNANLAINGANVNAVVTENNGRGVELSTGQDGNPNLTIEVKGGSLQASGQPNGIIFFTNKNNTQANANLKVSGNAMVKTSGITTEADGSGSQGAVLTTEAGTGETGGIVFNGSTGTVYGNASLQKDLIIGEGESLILDNGASLNANGHNVIVDGGTLDEGIKNSLGDSVKYTPTITTTSLPNGEVGTIYNQTLEATGSDTITWSVTGGSLPEGLSMEANTGMISGRPTAEGESTFTATATNVYGSDSREFTLSIDKSEVIPVTSVKLDKTSLTLQEKGSDTLTAMVEPDNATNKNVNWKSSDTSIATVDASGKVTAISAGSATITATAADGSGESASCSVTVTHGNMVHTPKKDATCTTPGKEGYYTCEICGKHFEDGAGNTEIANLDEYGIIPAAGHDAGTEWKSNGSSHWNECLNCGEKLNEAAHTFEWITDKEATAAEAGLKHEECTVCGYAKATVEIPATGASESSETGDDSNVALWAGILVFAAAVATGTVIYGRKRKEQ